ncbi:phage tail fiber protein [Trabulsiella odontotermitis]|uniref:Bacteriophage T7 tail fibre protein-like N-terminal domain-containing protein n=1 Tax=Trabulsiella odontotermitis TaxID=379893 RepID=A0A0L0GJK4_9ENTR|nr:phage tail fiber protein [Trabulsiella odontotermitis]KNC88976.1 hypothetical protein GM31_09130 [Trabulsiella odontotermitis]
MSVPDQTPYDIYNANGLTTVFPFEFYIIAASDIQVSIDGEVVISGYSVSGTGNVGGGDITFLTAPAAGSVVMLERVVPTYRLTDYQDNGDLLADTVNKDFDRLWMAIQRSFLYLGLALRRPLFGGPFDADGYRIAGLANPVNQQDAATKNYVDNVSLVHALRVPESYIPVLPSADQRANKLLAFNSVGNPILVLPPSGSASDVLIELAKPTGVSLIGTPTGTVESFISVEDYQRYGDIRGYGATNVSVDTVNDAVSAGETAGLLKVPKGLWNGNFELGNKTSISGESLTSSVINVPVNTIGIKPEGDDVRGITISNLNLQVDGAVQGGPPVGSGVGVDMSFTSKAVNCEFSNLYLDFFDIGYNAGPADFSNVYNNMRCNNNRIGINLTSNGQIIQNVFNGCYVANWTAFGLKISGASNQIFNGLNMGHGGAAGAYFVQVDTNSRGIVFNQPNFEMDASGGVLSAGSQAIVIASDSEVTFNSPVFNKVHAAGPSTYLFRVRGTAVVRINDPEVYSDDGVIGHLIVSDTATVYLNDPKKVFSVITIQGSGRLIRVNEKISSAPNYINILTVKSGDVINFGFYAKYAMASPDFHTSTMPSPFKYAVSFDTYNSAGTAIARVYDTTTGNGVSAVNVTCLVQAWREDR